MLDQDLPHPGDGGEAVTDGLAIQPGQRPSRQAQRLIQCGRRESGCRRLGVRCHGHQPPPGVSSRRTKERRPEPRRITVSMRENDRKHAVTRWVPVVPGDRRYPYSRMPMRVAKR